MKRKEKAGGYEILQSIRLGGRTILLGQNLCDKKAPYMTCYQQYALLGDKIYPDAIASTDFVEIMEIFTQRIAQQLRKVQDMRSQRAIPPEILGVEHCFPNANQQSLEGQLVILSPDSLSPEYRTADYQLGIALGGFGCDPRSRGQAVQFEELYSGEQTRWNRSDILGIANPAKLPEWAQQKLQERTPHTERLPKEPHGGDTR